MQLHYIHCVIQTPPVTLRKCLPLYTYSQETSSHFTTGVNKFLTDVYIYVLGCSHPATVRESTRAKHTTTASEKTWQCAVLYVSLHRRKPCEYFYYYYFFYVVAYPGCENFNIYVSGLKGF